MQRKKQSTLCIPSNPVLTVVCTSWWNFYTYINIVFNKVYQLLCDLLLLFDILEATISGLLEK